MAKKITIEDIDKAAPFVAELAGQTDRAGGIVAGTLLEALLEQILRGTLVEGKADELFVVYGPLSSFAAKINAATALGLITDSEQAELHTVRRVRSEFAHGLDHATFTTERISKQIRQLTLSRSRLTGLRTSLRKDFETAVMVLLGFLVARSQKTARIPKPRDHARGLIDKSPPRRSKSRNDGD